MKYKNHTNRNLLLQLPLIGFQAGYKAVFHAVGGVGGTADGIHLLAQGFVDSETVPCFVKAAFHDTLCKAWRFLVFQ